jgi:tetratricopeptide (TPR) repeat protein
VARARALEPSFYPGATLYEFETTAAADDPGLPGVHALVHHDGGATLLTGAAAPLYALNRRLGPRLEEPGQVAAYLQFFNRTVGGDEGLFQLVDRAADLHWTAAATPAERALAARLVQPVTLRRLDDGSWRAVTTIGYGRGLFEAVYAVEPDGRVTMLQDFLVNAHMPVVAEGYRDGVRVLEPGPVAEPGETLVRRFGTLTDVLMAAARRDDGEVAELALRAALRVYEANEPALEWNLDQVGAQYGLLAWYELLDGRVDTAVAAGERALALNGDSPLSRTNLAHALLLDGQRERAEGLYREVAAARGDDPERFLEVLEQDFDALREAGMGSPVMDQVVALVARGLGAGSGVAGEGDSAPAPEMEAR